MASGQSGGNSGVQAGSWYWCLRHKRAEAGEGCPADQRLGPYESKEAAESYADRVDARNERWDSEDRRWEGTS